MARYAHRVFVAFSQLLNTILGGQPCETLSHRAFLLRETSKFAAALCAVLGFFDKGHCEREAGR